MEYAYLQEQFSTGIDAGSSSGSGAWQQRNLTAVTNTISGASVANGKITLPAGTYTIAAETPSYFSGSMSTRWMKDGSGTVVVDGMSMYAPVDEIQILSPMYGSFVVPGGGATYRLESAQRTARLGDGLGKAVNPPLSAGAGNEVFSQVWLEKIA